MGASVATRLLLIFLLGILAGAVPVQSQDDLETCLSCHDDDEMTGTDRAGHEVSVYVDLESFQASVHGDMECVDCHQDLAGFDDYPHEEELEPVACAECHDDIAEVVEASIHNEAAARCADCHGKHTITSPGESDVGVAGINCGSCHKAIAVKYDASLHGREVHAGAELAPRCWDCHGAHDITKAHADDARVARFNIPFMCGECHKK